MATRSLVLSRAALALVVSICLTFGPVLQVARAAQDAPAEETGRGSIHGTVYQADEKKSLAGAKVTAINVRTGKQYSSEATGKSGNYDINGLPGGTYDLVIEMEGKLFVADHIIDVGQGESVSKSSRAASRSVYAASRSRSACSARFAQWFASLPIACRSRFACFCPPGC